MQSTAGNLEKAIFGDDASVPALLANLKSALGPQLDAIGTAIGEPAAIATSHFLSPKLSKSVVRLMSLIEANDGDTPTPSRKWYKPSREGSIAVVWTIFARSAVSLTLTVPGQN